MDSPQSYPSPSGLHCTLCLPHHKLLVIIKVVDLTLPDVLEGQTMGCSSLHFLYLSQVGFPGKQLEEEISLQGID